MQVPTLNDNQIRESTTETINSTLPLIHGSLDSLTNAQQLEKQKRLTSMTDLSEIKRNEQEIQDMLENVQSKCICVLDKFIENYSLESVLKSSSKETKESFPTELALLIEKINSYLKISKISIMDQRRSFMTSKKRPVDKTALLMDILHSIERLDSFLIENPTDIFDKIYDTKAKMENQTFSVSPHKQKVMEFAKTLDMIQKVQAYELTNQTAKLNTLANVVANIPEQENQIFEKQMYHPSKAFEEKLEIAKLTKIIDRIERSKMSNQEWASPEYKASEELEQLSIKIRALTNEETNAQRFVLSPEKEKELFLTNVMGRMNKQIVFNEQSAYLKRDRDFVKSEEIGPTVERLQKQPRLDNQSFQKVTKAV